LYYVVLSLWRRVFGDSDGALRSLGAVASVLTVAGTYVLARSLGGPLVAMLAAFMLAISPFQILAAQETRMYGLLAFITLLSWGSLLEAVQGKRWAWIGYVIATVCALYTHYFAFLSLIGQGIFVQATATRSRRSWLASQLAIVVLLIPWTTKISETIGWFHPFSATMPLVPPIAWGDVITFLSFLTFGGHAFGFGGWYGGTAGSASAIAQIVILAPFLALAVYGAVVVRERPRSLWFLLCYLVVPVAIVAVLSVRAGMFLPRYFSFVAPPFAILMAHGIVRLAQRLAPAHPYAVGVALGLFVLLFNAAGLRDARSNPRHDVFNWRAVAMLLTKEAGPNDLIAVFPGFDHPALARYFHGSQQVLLGYPAPPDEDDAGIVKRGRAAFRSHAAKHEVIWFVIGYQVRQPALTRLQRELDGIYEIRSETNFQAIRVFRATGKP